MPKRKPDKEKYFWSYVSAMKDLNVSRRTLQRWINDLDIEPMEFEDHLKVFLRLPDMEHLRMYRRFMATHDPVLIGRYKDAVRTGNSAKLTRLLKKLC